MPNKCVVPAHHVFHAKYPLARISCLECLCWSISWFNLTCVFIACTSCCWFSCFHSFGLEIVIKYCPGNMSVTSSIEEFSDRKTLIKRFEIYIYKSYTSSIIIAMVTLHITCLISHLPWQNPCYFWTRYHRIRTDPRNWSSEDRYLSQTICRHSDIELWRTS